MKVLIAATALTGHINPLLAVGRRLAARGDDVVMMTAERFRTKIEASGSRRTTTATRPSTGRRTCRPVRSAIGSSSPGASSIPSPSRPGSCGR
jgi:UDP-N-acetylglucosamine:LPS N-acetylglucosamine transferase